MKPGVPWSVKGVEPEVREAAKHVARKWGMTLGEWLNTVILETADAEGVTAPQHRSGSARTRHTPAPATLHRESDESTIARRLDHLADQLAEITRHQQDTSAGRLYGWQEPDHIDPGRILDRIERHEHQTAAALDGMNTRLGKIGGQLEEIAATIPRRPEDVHGHSALQDMLSTIVNHIEANDRRTREGLKAMQERIAALAMRAAGGDRDKLAGTSQALARLEQKMASLASRIDRPDPGMTRSSREDVDARMSEVVHRIERVEAQIESAAAQAADSVLGQVRDEFTGIEQRLHALTHELRATADRGANERETLSTVRNDITDLEQRINQLSASAASENDVRQVETSIKSLLSKIGNLDGDASLADMERRLTDLTERLEYSLAEQPDRSQLSEIEQRIDALDAKLQSAMQTSRDDGARAELERQIASLSERLVTVEQGFGHLATIENSLRQLFEAVEQNGLMVREMADNAARQAVEQIRDSGYAVEASAPSRELRALQQGLEAVRAGASEADQRTQETLGAVHETLEKIVNRLADLESVAYSEEPSRSQKGTPFAAAPETQSEYGDPSADADTATHPGSGGDIPESLREMRLPPLGKRSGPDTFAAQPDDIEENQRHGGHKDDFAKRPEPRIDAFAPGASETLAVHRSSAGQGSYFQGNDVSGITRQDDFIAAARRAAQAAAQKPQHAGERRNPLRRLMGRAKSEGEATSAADPDLETADSAGPSGAASQNGDPKSGGQSKRRPLILAGTVLLMLAASAYGLMSNVTGEPFKRAIHSLTQDDTAVVPPEPGYDASRDARAATMPPGQSQTREHQSVGFNADRLMTGSISRQRDSGPPAVGLPVLAPEELDRMVPSTTRASSARMDMPAPERATALPELPESIGPQSLREAAAEGQPLAQHIIATRFADGHYTERDPASAVRWYQQAAGKGFAPSQYRLGTLFERGLGVPQSIDNARIWYKRAAQKGHVKAMHNLAVLYAEPNGSQPEFAEAARWFARAAAHGLKDSQYNLAILHERGLGVPQDTGEAFRWYSIAAAGGDADAADRVNSMRETIPETTVAAIEAQVREWTPEPIPEEANFVSAPSEWAGSGATAEDSGKPVETPEHIAEAQALLNELGFDAGEPDGVLGPRTADALRLFQLRNGLEVNGTLTEGVLTNLRNRQG